MNCESPSLTLTGSAQLLDAVRPRVEALGSEALAVEVTLDASPAEGAHRREVSIDGEPLVIGLTLA